MNKKYNLHNRSISFWIDTHNSLRAQSGTINEFDNKVVERNKLICIKENQPLKYNLDTHNIWTYPVQYKTHMIYSIIGNV